MKKKKIRMTYQNLMNNLRRNLKMINNRLKEHKLLSNNNRQNNKNYKTKLKSKIMKFNS